MAAEPDREHVLAIVRQIMGSSGAEDEITPPIDDLNASVPHPAASDLIFWPEREFTAEEIANIAVGWRPGMPLRTDPKMSSG